MNKIYIFLQTLYAVKRLSTLSIIQTVMDGDTMGVGKFMSKSVMVDCRYLSLALKHNLAVSMSLEQTWDISLLNMKHDAMQLQASSAMLPRAACEGSC